MDFVYNLAVVAGVFVATLLLFCLSKESPNHDLGMLGCLASIVGMGVSLTLFIAFPWEGLTVIALLGAYLFIQTRLD